MHQLLTLTSVLQMSVSAHCCFHMYTTITTPMCIKGSVRRVSHRRDLYRSPVNKTNTFTLSQIIEVLIAPKDSNDNKVVNEGLKSIMASINASQTTLKSHLLLRQSLCRNKTTLHCRSCAALKETMWSKRLEKPEIYCKFVWRQYRKNPAAAAPL